MKDRQNLQDSGQGSIAAPAVGNKKNQSIEFKMPSGSQLSNLCKIQVSGMQLQFAGGEMLSVDNEVVKWLESQDDEVVKWLEGQDDKQKVIAGDESLEALLSLSPACHHILALLKF